MAKQTKLQVWNSIHEDVSTLIEVNKVSKKFSEALLLLLENTLAPKSGASANPPKLDDEGHIVEAYCRFHAKYEKIENMVVSAGKSKGYCKASISLWNKTNSNIKKLESSAIAEMSTGNFEGAQEIAKEAQELRGAFNAPDFYDYDRDWANFLGSVDSE